MFHSFPDKEPTSFEIKILKWVFLPIITFGLFSMFIDVSKGRNKCEDICHEKGFLDFRYTPRGRFGISGNTCHCLTEEESEIKNRIPEGTRVF